MTKKNKIPYALVQSIQRERPPAHTATTAAYQAMLTVHCRHFRQLRFLIPNNQPLVSGDKSGGGYAELASGPSTAPASAVLFEQLRRLICIRTTFSGSLIVHPKH